MSCLHRTIAASALLVLCAASAHGQANFVESFNENGSSTGSGPAGLVGRGWVLRNQSSSAIEPLGWFDGAIYGQTAQEGSGCLYTASMLTVPFTGNHTLSNWAILPAIADQDEGAILSLFISGVPLAAGDQKLQIRYAPGGGTNTGSGPAGVGDFTELLGEFSSTNSWQQIAVPVPGPGRLALRQYDPAVSNFPSGGVVMKIDSLSVAGGVSGPCGMPLPQPGETVTWRTGDSPYSVCAKLTIPRGGTVVVEPGVTIAVEAGGPQLIIEGELIAHGTAAAPIALLGENFSIINPPYEVRGGVLDMQHVSIEARIQTRYGATLLAADCEIPATGTIAASPNQAQDPGSPDPQALTFRLERCEFVGGELSAVSNVYVSDCNFIGGRARVAGFVYLNNITVDGIPLEVEKDAGAQPLLIDHVSATGSLNTAGLSLSGANYHIGPSTVLQGNRWPIEFTVLAAGLTPDSVVPATGNAVNKIYARALDSGYSLVWPDLGVPYLVDRTVQSGGSLTILPGTTIQFEEAGGAIFLDAPIGLSGTPDRPVRLVPAQPGQNWAGIEFFQVPSQLVQNVEVRGAAFGMGSDESNVWLIDSTFTGNDIAGTANTFGELIVRNCRFLTNRVGLQTGSTTGAGSFDAAGFAMPNSFIGNDVGVQVNSPLPTNSSAANYSWWGDSSGPQHPQLPGAVGDPAQIRLDRLLPFLEEAPTYTNHAPRVRVEPGPLFARPGERIIIRWTLADDGPIVAQRVEYSPAAGGFPFVTLAELGPQTRTFEYEVQAVAPSTVNSRAALRVVAVDDAGNESWDVVPFWVPYQDDWTPPAIEVAAPTQLRPGDFFDLTWSPTATAAAFVEVASEGTLNLVPAGGHTGGGNNPKRMPYASTDLVRFLVIFTFGAGGREEYYFSDYFTVRPDDRIGDDTPPTVTLITPTLGQQFAGGSVVPVTWAADDDEGIREFDIHASYDGGETWWTVVRGLAPQASSFNWRLPDSNGIGDVRVRVIARDVRFQTTSDGMDVAFVISAGASAQPGDFDTDSDIDGNDYAVWHTCMAGPGVVQPPDGCSPDDFAHADLDGDTDVDLADLVLLAARITG